MGVKGGMGASKDSHAEAQKGMLEVASNGVHAASERLEGSVVQGEDDRMARGEDLEMVPGRDDLTRGQSFASSCEAGNESGGRVPTNVLARASMVAAGVQFGWALQLSLLTPYVQELGIPHEWASFVWLCGPISGLIVQPAVGVWSDSCSSRWGPRTPFIFMGTCLIALAMLLISFSADIGYWLGDADILRRDGSRPYACGVFVAGFWMLDLANNTLQGPCRALVADMAGDDQRTVGNAFFTLWMALGNVLGFATGASGAAAELFPGEWRTPACGTACANLKAAFFFALVFLVACCTVTLLSAIDEPLEPDEAEDQEEEDEVEEVEATHAEDVKRNAQPRESLSPTPRGEAPEGSAEEEDEEEGRVAQGEGDDVLGQYQTVESPRGRYHRGGSPSRNLTGRVDPPTGRLLSFEPSPDLADVMTGLPGREGRLGHDERRGQDGVLQPDGGLAPLGLLGPDGGRGSGGGLGPDGPWATSPTLRVQLDRNRTEGMGRSSSVPSLAPLGRSSELVVEVEGAVEGVPPRVSPSASPLRTSPSVPILGRWKPGSPSSPLHAHLAATLLGHDPRLHTHTVQDVCLHGHHRPFHHRGMGSAAQSGGPRRALPALSRIGSGGFQHFGPESILPRGRGHRQRRSRSAGPVLTRQRERWQRSCGGAFLGAIYRMALTFFTLVFGAACCAGVAVRDVGASCCAPLTGVVAEIVGGLRSLSPPMRLVMAVMALSWMGWFPFLLFDTDWMGREVYHGIPGGGSHAEGAAALYQLGVQQGAWGLLLTSVVQGFQALRVDSLCSKFGHKRVWIAANLIHALGLASTSLITRAARRTTSSTSDPHPSTTVRFAALGIFAILGIPLAITSIVPYALAADLTAAEGIYGQGLAMGVLNLAVVVPQLIVSVGAGPWDKLFGGGNEPAFIGAALFTLAAAVVLMVVPLTGPSAEGGAAKEDGEGANDSGNSGRDYQPLPTGP